MAALKNEGVLKFDVAGVEVALAEEDLLIDVAKMEGYVTEGDNYVTVVIDTTLTPELIEEGFVREIISKVQTMRKDADYNVTDKIVLGVSGNDKITEIINSNADEIKRVCLINEITADTSKGDVKDWSINGEKVVFSTAVC